ncbi:unnamed protein product [Dracunculus medinensis]|uniref:WD_REPEATS_REGION domain-containing protein n=1 Tax=Dracunculus medinensis TaxID=318479 RepID=A0A158Q4T8_DRAME|nr:unnamed protein product [Dracunculus medinensis]
MLCCRLCGIPEKRLLLSFIFRSKATESQSSQGILYNKDNRFEEPLECNAKGINKQADLEKANKDVSAFVFGGINGGIYLSSKIEEIKKVFQVESAVVSLLYVEEMNVILALCQDSMIYQFKITATNSLEEKYRVMEFLNRLSALKYIRGKAKLNGKWPQLQIILLDGGILAMCSDTDLFSRIWDLKTGDNGSLPLRAVKGYSASDTITCIAYSKRKSKIATWKYRMGKEDNLAEERWKLQEAIEMGSEVMILSWNNISNILAISTRLSTTILKEQVVLSEINKNLVLIQMTSRSFLMIRINPAEQQELVLTINIILYDIIDSPSTPIKAQISSNFACSVTSAKIYETDIYCLEIEKKVTVRTFQKREKITEFWSEFDLQGTIKEILSLPEMEGDAVMLELNNSWICIPTSNGFLRIYDLTGR